MKKKTSRKKLIEKLDKVFSLFIRLRDNCICYTCGKRGEIRQMQAGHYVSRKCMLLRWDEKNVHCQCYACNVCKHGDLITYRERLVKDYGQSAIEELESKRYITYKHSIEDLEKLIDFYKNAIDKIK